jgi:hypothetical protein
MRDFPADLAVALQSAALVLGDGFTARFAFLNLLLAVVLHCDRNEKDAVHALLVRYFSVGGPFPFSWETNVPTSRLRAVQRAFRSAPLVSGVPRIARTASTAYTMIKGSYHSAA